MSISSNSISGKAFDRQRSNFTGDSWDKISVKAKDCIKKMLRVNPKERPTARELLDCSWFNVSQCRCINGSAFISFSLQGSAFEKIKKSLPSPVPPRNSAFQTDVLSMKCTNANQLHFSTLPAEVCPSSAIVRAEKIFLLVRLVNLWCLFAGSAIQAACG